MKKKVRGEERGEKNCRKDIEESIYGRKLVTGNSEEGMKTGIRHVENILLYIFMGVIEL